jgi:aryl-alcohol dehydrogenase-like predicted oxidoreductase
MMHKRQLGNSGIEISEIGLGSWLTYSGGIERERSRACTKEAFDLGITFFDTANVYGQGTAETVWGEILAEYPRSSYVLATKLWGRMPDGQGLSAAQVHIQLDASLRRLQTDYIDLYQCHRFDLKVPVAETLGALSEVVRAGKVRAIGFSEWTPEQIQAALDLPEFVRFTSSQPQYSLLWRAPEKEVFPLSAANGISQVVWSPLAEGVLTGKYKPGEAPPQDSRAASTVMSTMIGRKMGDATLEAVQRLRPIAEGVGLTMSQLALAWVLRRPEVASAIVGASRPEQLRDSVGASGVRLEDSVLKAIEAALGDVPQREPKLASFAEPGLGPAPADGIALRATSMWCSRSSSALPVK